MEFKLIQPKEFIDTIDFNFDELIEQVEKGTKKYKGLIFTEETLPEAKIKIKDLKSLRNALENKRKEVKNEIMKPYNDFEAKIKQILVVIDKPIAEIDGQIKGFEEEEKQKKKQEIKDYFDDEIEKNKSKLEKLEINFNLIFDMRYLNKTYKIQDVKKDIDTKIEKIISDIDVIKIQGEYVFEMLDDFKNHFDLSRAIKKGAELKDLAERKKEMQRLAQEREAQRQEMAKIEAEKKARTPEQVEAVKEMQELEELTKKIVTVRLVVKNELDKFTDLKRYLTENNFEFSLDIQK